MSICVRINHFKPVPRDQNLPYQTQRFQQASDCEAQYIPFPMLPRIYNPSAEHTHIDPNPGRSRGVMMIIRSFPRGAGNRRTLTSTSRTETPPILATCRGVEEGVGDESWRKSWAGSKSKSPKFRDTPVWLRGVCVPWVRLACSGQPYPKRSCDVCRVWPYSCLIIKAQILQVPRLSSTFYCANLNMEFTSASLTTEADAELVSVTVPMVHYTTQKSQIIIIIIKYLSL